mmetsp:Transcript_7146/g.23701  ORF Transcript_7146/g.23701 Transcript_7146/m.23701 type:complete len:81 (-) Transcript_7146:144-386(-)
MMLHFFYDVQNNCFPAPLRSNNYRQSRSFVLEVYQVSNIVTPRDLLLLLMMLVLSPSMLKEPPVVAQTRRGAATATAALE